MEIRYSTVDSPLGRLLVAATGRGVCFVGMGDDDERLEAALAREHPAAGLRRDHVALGPWAQTVVAQLDGREPRPDLPLDVQGSAFQWKVWQALRQIPPGQTRTYGEIAAGIGKPGAARAVARACASNPAAVIIPCHRAVGADGALTGYRWGLERKRALLERESAK